MYCKGCGNQLPDDAKFCGKCGNSVTGNQTMNLRETQNRSSSLQKPKKCKKGIAVGIIGFFIIVLLFGGFWILRYETIYVLTEYESDDWRGYFTYDENGNCMEMKVYDDSEDPSYQYTYTYDNRGKCIKELVFNERGQIDHSRSHEWDYDENGNCVEYLSYDEDGNLYVDRKWNYGENTIEEYWYYSNTKSLMDYSLYEYDEKENKLKETYYSGDGKEYNGYTEEIYNEQGKVLSDSRYLNTGALYYCWEHEYDFLGNRVSSLQYGENGDLESFYEFSYDEDGNQIYVECWLDGIRAYYVEYSYDENGNVLTGRSYDNENLSGILECIYDENGNRIEQIVNKERRVSCKYEALKVARTDWFFGVFSDEMEEKNILLDSIHIPSSRAVLVIEQWNNNGGML